MSLVKRLGSGHFTLLNAELAGKRENLCDQCGAIECTINLILHRLKVNKQNASVEVKTCKSFRPVLDFRDPAGTEFAFNTFRLGMAWSRRVFSNDVVALRGPKGLYGEAKVLGTHSGPFAAMREQFGDDNHLAIAAAVAEQDFDLESVMRKNYGPNRFSASSNVSVIYLERLRV